jgi:lauroyl/myristoyl acyltransferase
MVPQDDRVSGAGIALRLYTSRHTHRLLPARLALPLAAAIGPAVRQRRNPAERRDGDRFMRELLAHTPRAAEAETLGREWLEEKSRMRELFWRPWLLKRSRILGRENWDAAHADGRGCVIVLAHMAATWAGPAILARAGYEFYIIAGAHYWQPMPAGYTGLALLHQRREYGEKVVGTDRMISTGGRPARLLELLERGESLVIAFDAPGFAATPFLGRTIALGGGVATAAFRTKARLLPIVPERHGARLDVRLYPPIDPLDFADARALRAAIAAAFEPVVVERPQTVELAWHPHPLVTAFDPSSRSIGILEASADAP